MVNRFDFRKRNFSSPLPLATRGGRRRRKWWLVGILILAIFFLFTYVLPEVTVVVVLSAENVSQELDIQLSTDQAKINPVNNIFPAKLFSLEETLKEKFSPTGQKDLGERASGQAVFFNNTGPSQPIMSDQDLITDQGIIFRVKESITVPGARVDSEGKVVAGQITAKVIAKEAGEKANGATGHFNIISLPLEKQEKIYGQLSGALSGGTSKIVTVVSQEDIDRAKEQLQKKLEPQLKEKIRAEAGEDFSVMEQLLKYEVANVAQEVTADSEVKDFELGLTLKATALTYDNWQLRQALKDKIMKTLSAEQSIAGSETGSLEIIKAETDFNLGWSDLKIKTTFPVVKKVDLNEIKKNILGKTESEARRYLLSLPYVKDVRFMFALNLSSRIPNFSQRVTVKISDR